MTPRILSADYAERIRYRLGVQESHLTAQEIDEVLPEVEQMVLDYVESSDSIYLQSAVVCLCASALCSVLRKKFPIKEQGPSGSFETPIDWDVEEERLRVLGNSFLYKVKPPNVKPRFQVR